MTDDVHGGDGARIARDYGLDPATVLDLSLSLNPVAPDPTPSIRAVLDDAIARYPETGRATAALADCLRVAPARVVLTNGGAEAIALVAAELGVARIDEPEFSLFRRHLDAVDADAPRVRSNPNNPTGRLAAPDEGAAVWDEAFWPLATGTWTRGDADCGATVVGSLTKLFACPGLRIGYVLAPDPTTAARIRRRQPEWAVNGLAAAALPALLSSSDLTGWHRATVELRKDLVGVLRAHELEPARSDANWVLVHAPGLRARLAPVGVVVRDCASFGLDGWARIAVPNADGLARLDDALRRTAP